MAHIGGLLLDKLPCNCGAPYAETSRDVDGSIKVILWKAYEDKDSEMLFEQPSEDNDDLGMVCTRCGWRL